VVQIALSVAFLIALSLVFLLDNSFPFHLKLNSAWQVEMQAPSLDIFWIYSAEASDNLWALTNDLGHPYRVYNQAGKVNKNWDMPELVHGDYPQRVSGDKDGEPIVWFEDRVLHYSGDIWETIFYNDGLDLSDLRYRSVITGEQGWFMTVIEERAKLINVNALTGEWQEISLPEKAIQLGFKPLQVKQAVNGDIMVLAVQEKNARVYFWSNGGWNNEEYAFTISNILAIEDYFLDANENLWILINDENQMVEKIPMSGEISLTYLPPPPSDGRGLERYDYLIVDSHNRLWVSGGYPQFIVAFSPQWNARARTLTIYNTKNSSYQGDIETPPVYFENGLIVSGDNYISSINTNIENLPNPLPDWFSRLDMNLIRLYIMFPYLAFAFLNMNLYKNPNYRKSTHQ